MVAPSSEGAKRYFLSHKAGGGACKAEGEITSEFCKNLAKNDCLYPQPPAFYNTFSC